MGTLEEDDDKDNQEHTTEEVVEHENPETPEQPDVEVVEESAEDERLAAPEEDEEEDGKPARRRESAKDRRLRAKEAKDRDKRELDFQRREMRRLEDELRKVRDSQIEKSVTDLDNRISTALQDVDTMDRVKAAAIAKNNGEDAVKADNLKAQAIQRANEAQWQKQELIRQAQTQQSAPPYQDLAMEFMRNNPWYNHTGNDEDSRIVKDIDNGVAKDFVPTSPRYWQELQRRVEKHFPDRYQKQSTQDDDMEEPPAPQRKGPPVGGSSRSNSSTTTQIKLSAERVQAMREAGLWEDPKLRAKMAKKYAEYDRDNG